MMNLIWQVRRFGENLIIVAAAAAVIVEVVLPVSVAPAVVAPPVEIIPISDDRREYGACKINS